MLNALRPALTRVLTPVADVVAGALWLFPTGHLFAGTMVCTGFVLADMLDGLLARVKGTTGAWGAFLDSTLDRIGDAAVFAGVTIWLVRTGQDGLAWVALFCLVAGMMVSYAKARAEGLGIPCNVGVAERTERLLITLVATGLTGLGVPYVLAIGLWALAALSVVTFGQRVDAVRRGAAARTVPATLGLSPERDDGGQPEDPRGSAARE